MKTSHIVSLILFFLLVSFIAFSGRYATDEALSLWYESLAKPSWNPPAWLFAPVWTILYIFIALAGWLYYIAQNSIERTKTLLYYFIQLFLNAIWPFVFFSMKNPGLGFVVIVFMAIFIALTIYEGFKVSKLASYLLIPYLLWTLFALSVNGGTYYLNY